MVKYDPLTRTAFLFNIDYYGWVKSIALALAGDILEDQHHIHSVHGAALDIGGQGRIPHRALEVGQDHPFVGTAPNEGCPPGHR